LIFLEGFQKRAFVVYSFLRKQRLFNNEHSISNFFAAKSFNKNSLLKNAGKAREKEKDFWQPRNPVLSLKPYQLLLLLNISVKIEAKPLKNQNSL